MIGKKAEVVLNRALTLAAERKHEFLTLEHVMLSLLEELEIKQTLEHCKGNPEKMKEDILAYLQKEVPLAPENEKGESETPIATLGVQRLSKEHCFRFSQQARPKSLRSIYWWRSSKRRIPGLSIYLRNKGSIAWMSLVSSVTVRILTNRQMSQGFRIRIRPTGNHAPV